MAEKQEESKDERYGEAAYEAQGRPLFGKVWTFEELQNVERPGFRRKGKAVLNDMKKPDNWPADTEVEKGKWVSWLPEGWMQGIRTQIASGKQLSCYMSPVGKRFWHKKDIEKFLGYMLEAGLPSRRKAGDDDEEPIKRVKYVTDPDVIPNWPEDEEDWLPKDFKIAFRQLPSGPHRIYIPPGTDDGFLYHRSSVAEYLSGTNTKLSSFGSSRPQSAISADVANGVRDDDAKVKKKKRRMAQPMVAEYAEFSDLALARLPPSSCGDAAAADALLRKAGAPNPEALGHIVADVYAGLLRRRFSEETAVLAVFSRGDNKCSIKLVEQLCGVYYERPGRFADHPFYQRVFPSSSSAAGLSCSSLHIFWSMSRGNQTGGFWKIGSLDNGMCPYAFCPGACGDPTDLTGPFQLLQAEAASSEADQAAG